MPLPYLKIVYPLALVGRKKIQLKRGSFTLLLLSFLVALNMAEEISFRPEDIHFQKDLPESFELECPTCYDLLLNEPHLSECCGRHFCGPCSRRLLFSPRFSPKPKCPLCNSVHNFRMVRDKSHDRDLSNQIVYCIHENESPLGGCKWSGELRQLKHHVNFSCIYTNEQCTQCFKTMKRYSLKEHKNKDCPERPHDCQYCGFQGPYSLIVNEHHFECPFYPLPCPLKCASTILRCQLAKHLEVDCPLQPVECMYSWRGCNKKPKRKDAEEHYSESHQLTLIHACKELFYDFRALQHTQKNSDLRCSNSKETFLRDIEGVQDQQKLLEVKLELSLLALETRMTSEYEKCIDVQHENKIELIDMKSQYMDLKDEHEKLMKKTRRLKWALIVLAIVAFAVCFPLPFSYSLLAVIFFHLLLARLKPNKLRSFYLNYFEIDLGYYIYFF